MKISTKGRYGLRIMIDIAVYGKGECVSLKDIAEKAGVSMMTVSNVINGKHNRVSAKTIEKVNQIIREYDYVPNLSARSLTNKTSIFEFVYAT